MGISTHVNKSFMSKCLFLGICNIVLYIYKEDRDDLRSAQNLSTFLFVLLFRPALAKMSKFHYYPMEFRYILEPL